MTSRKGSSASAALKGQPGAEAPCSEREILNRIRAGEPELFHEFVRRYDRAIYIVAYSVLQNHADAEEVAQDTILKAFMRLDQLQDATKFKPWILQIAINQARLRRSHDRSYLNESLEPDIQDDGDVVRLSRDFACWREIPSDWLERKEIREIIGRALEQLPEIYRQIFVLRDVEELSVIETARLLSITESAVKVRLHRARLQMRELLTPTFKQPEPPAARFRKENRW